MSEHLTTQTQTAVKPTFTPIVSGMLQRACACGQHTGSGGECEECKQKREGTLQRAAINPSPVHEVPPIVYEVLRSPGQPLDTATRALMEPRFEHDFSGVRVHTDAKAAESARTVNALAYTVGQNVVFGAGQFAPQTDEGRKLVAHELTHTLQQNSGAEDSHSLELGPAHDSLEQEAITISSYIPARISPDRPKLTQISPKIQRQSTPVEFNLEIPTPQEAERLRRQGIQLPSASSEASDPRQHGDFIDSKVNAVGFGIYLGGYILYVDGIDIPLFVPESYVLLGLQHVENVDNVIYPNRESAQRSIPFGPPTPEQGYPVTYYRGGYISAPQIVFPTVFPQPQHLTQFY